MINENLLLLDSSSSSDSDLEDVLVMEVLNPNLNGPENRREIYGAFNLNNFSENECKSYFRFEKNDIPRLAEALRVPQTFHTRSGHKVSRIEGLCLLLRRLAYPNRLVDLEPMFGRSSPGLSQVIDYMIDHVTQNFGHLVSNLRNLPWLDQNRLRLYANAIQAKGSPIPNCWGFIDGTARAICRPTQNQEAYYSGHKRQHCVKYQAITCPDGMVVSLKGAYEGRKHDAGIFRESDLYNELQEHCTFPDESFVLYGDCAYGIRELLLCPYPTRPRMDPEQVQFNNRMSTVRIAVEWGFGKVLSEFAFLDFKKNQKLLLQEVGAMYVTGVILSNCHSCLYSNQTAQAFNVNPVNLEEYLA